MSIVILQFIVYLTVFVIQVKTSIYCKQMYICLFFVIKVKTMKLYLIVCEVTKWIKVFVILF